MVEVAADLGVRAAESGVKGVRILGESSVLAERIAGSTGVLPDRKRLSDIWRLSRGMAALGAGITKGVRLLGESGCRSSGAAHESFWFTPLSSALSSGESLDRIVWSARCWCFHELTPGALMERSCRGGRPGIVATTC